LDSSLFFFAQASLWKIVLNRVDLQRLNGFVFYLTDFTERKMIFTARTPYLIFKEQKPELKQLEQKGKPYIPVLNHGVLRLKMIKPPISP
jgi:hypothetical protein